MRSPDSDGRGEVKQPEDRSLLPGLGHFAVLGRDLTLRWVGHDPGLLFPQAPLACYADADMELGPKDTILTPEQTEELRRELAA
jgi:hypothetical protein